MQAFYFVNRFREHLAAAPISFSPRTATSRAATACSSTPTTARPALAAARLAPLDNAYMDTPPDGTLADDGDVPVLNSGDFRDVNGGDDAAIVYHEYTHGLSSRLVTVAPGGEQALNAPQAGAMGEGWSDWYAKDFLVDQFPRRRHGGARRGRHGRLHRLGARTRSARQPLDCPVGASRRRCPGTPAPGSGGYTYGDFGNVLDAPRGPRRRRDLGRDAVGPARRGRLRGGREIVTDGMRLSPPEPTFLEMRNAILARRPPLFPQGDHSGAIWAVFGARGMGDGREQPHGRDGRSGPQVCRPRRSRSRRAAPCGAARDARRVGVLGPRRLRRERRLRLRRRRRQRRVRRDRPQQTFTYPAAGTFHPVVTVHDNEGRTDTASSTVEVASPPRGHRPDTPPAAARAPRTAGHAPADRDAVAVSRLTVRCDAACSGTARLTVSRRLARRLGLGGTRRVGRLRFRLTAAGRREFHGPGEPHDPPFFDEPRRRAPARGPAVGGRDRCGAQAIRAQRRGAHPPLMDVAPPPDRTSTAAGWGGGLPWRAVPGPLPLSSAQPEIDWRRKVRATRDFPHSRFAAYT